MMYAIIETGGKQYRVQEGNVLKVEKLEVLEGETVELDRVLAFKKDEELTIGAPFLAGVKVVAQVLEQGRGKKIIVFKYKAKKNYRRTQGHRQSFTKLRIEKIEG
jgi:large subunit ribosomal protein L21